MTTALDQQVAGIQSHIASRNVQIRALTQLELEQPHAKSDFVALRRKQRSELLRENAHDSELLTVLSDPSYASHVAAADAVKIEAFEAKKAAARDVTTEHEATEPLYAAADAAAATFLQSLAELRKALAENVEPLFFHALKPLADANPSSAEDSIFVHVDRVRGQDWHMNYALARVVRQALDILNIGGSQSFVSVGEIPYVRDDLPGTFADAHTHAVAKIATVLTPIKEAVFSPYPAEVRPGWVVAAGPVKGSEDEKYQTQLAAAKVPDVSADPRTAAELHQRRLETDPEYAALIRESVAIYLPK